MTKKNKALLILDCDKTIIWKHLHNYLTNLRKSDFDSGWENAVTAEDIEKFLKDTEGIKNAKELKDVLQYALSNGIKVKIASFTAFPRAVEELVKKHLGLSEEQAKSISVFGGFPKDYDSQNLIFPKLEKLSFKEQQRRVGKNLHICRAIAEENELVDDVMLVDDDKENIRNVNEFVKSMGTGEKWLKANELSIEAIENIKFKGVQAPTEKGGDDRYLERVKEFIRAHSIKEPIYENLKKEEPVYATVNKISLEKDMGTIKSVLMEKGHNKVREVHNVQDLFREWAIEALKEQGYGVSSKERKEIIVKGSEQIDTEKVQKIIEGALGRVIKGFEALKRAPEENIFQNLQDIRDIEDIQDALKAKAESVHQSAPPVLPKPKQLNAVDLTQNNENPPVLPKKGSILGTKIKSIPPGTGPLQGKEQPVYATVNKITISLEEEMGTIESVLAQNGHMQDLFKEEAIEALKEQGYGVSSKEREKIIVTGREKINVEKVQKIIEGALDRVIKGFEASKRTPEGIYENLKGIESALKAKAESVHQSAPKRKSDSDNIGAEGMPSEAKRMILDPKIKSILPGTEKSLSGEKYAHTKTFSLAQNFRAIKAFFGDCIPKIINTIFNLFKKEVATKIEVQGYNVSNKEESSEIIIKGSKPIGDKEIKTHTIDVLEQFIKNKEEIKDLVGKHKGERLKQEISKLCNPDLQGRDINSNYKEEPIFQTRKEAFAGQDQQRKPPVPPKSRMQGVTTTEGQAQGNTRSR